MPVLNDADAIYIGTDPVDAVYVGDELVWSASPVEFDDESASE